MACKEWSISATQSAQLHFEKSHFMTLWLYVFQYNGCMSGFIWCVLKYLKEWITKIWIWIRISTLCVNFQITFKWHIIEYYCICQDLIVPFTRRLYKLIRKKRNDFILTYLSVVINEINKHLGLSLEVLVEANPADFFLWLFSQYIVNSGDYKT